MRISTRLAILFFSCMSDCVAISHVAARRQRILRLKPLAVLYPRALDLHIDSCKDPRIELTTGIYRFGRNEGRNVIVDLFSMVHVADATYFDTIKSSMGSYDLVLYELITDTKNCKLVDGCDYKRQLKVDVFTPDSEKLAREYALATQSELYNIKPTNWFIADLDSLTVARLESSRRAETTALYRLSQIAGRAAQQRFLKKFFLSDTVLLTTLRMLSWLAPCPELSCLMVDWSRMTPKAGGLPAVLLPILENILAGRVAEARKLAFAQQLLSGMPDAGAWGGEAMSDVEIRVGARNAECVRVLNSFIKEFDNSPRSDPVTSDGSNGEVSSLKVAILYGAYHINDLSLKIKSLGFTPQRYTPFGTEVEAIPSREEQPQNPLVPSRYRESLEAGVIPAWTMRPPTANIQPMIFGTKVPGQQRRVYANSRVQVENLNADDKASDGFSESSDMSAAYATIASSSTSTSTSDGPVIGADPSTTTRTFSSVRMNGQSSHTVITSLPPAKLLATIGIGSIAYLLLGALDWWILLDYLVELGEKLFGPVNEASAGSLGKIGSNVVMKVLVALNNVGSDDISTTTTTATATVTTTAATNMVVSLDLPLAWSFTVMYVWLYVQRHTVILRAVSSFGIQWDRGLFEDVVMQEQQL